MRKISVLLSLAVSLCTSASAQHRSALQSMQLLTAQVGWAATDGRLFWTSTAGSRWRDITPRTAPTTEIASVFFVDTSRGWILLTSRDEFTNDVSGFTIASTNDAGTNWSMSRVRIPKNFDLKNTALAGDGRMDFVDAVHGWMNVGLVSSSNTNSGLVLATADGGKTWANTVEDPGVRGSIRFADTSNGWLAGGPGNEHLYATHDGAHSWQEVSVTSPSELPSEINAMYDLPVFENSKRGFLPVTYAGLEGEGLSLVLFDTDDGGMTWKVDRVFSHLPEIYSGMAFPSAVVKSALINATVSDRARLILTKSLPGGTAPTTKAALVPPGSVVLSLSFTDLARGWVLTSDALLSIGDDGITLADITPRAALRPAFHTSHNATYALRPANDQAPNQLPSKPSYVSNATGPTSYVSRHLGFHSCNALTTDQMKTWWTYSPFVDAGIYIGGSNRSCANRILDANWITAVTSQGWGLMPTWPGPQAPCTCAKGTFPKCTKYFRTYVKTDGTAQMQGQNEADAAVGPHGVAEGLGLNAGSVIYYDMENYTPSTTIGGAACGNYVNAFLNGWVSEIHKSGYLAGIYGGPAPAADWHNNNIQPDDVWIAKADKRVTIWGLNSPGSGLTDSMWSNEQRIHQYTSNASVAYGGLGAPIDNDIEDAEVTGGKGGKTYDFSNFTFTSFDADPSCGIPPATQCNTQAYYVNNVGTIVGMYTNSSGQHAFLSDAGGLISWDCPGGIGYTVAQAINNAGQVVGYFEDSNLHTHGFKYKKGGSCAFFPDYPGAEATEARGINDAGWISGGFHLPNATQHDSFINYPTRGFDPIDYFGADGTHVAKINGIGRFVGHDPISYMSFLGYGTCPFCFIPLPSYPGATQTIATGISNNNLIVGGWFVSSTNSAGGFLYNDDTVNFTPISYPGATGGTVATVMNDLGTVVGYYADSRGTHAFVAVPPP